MQLTVKGGTVTVTDRSIGLGAAESKVSTMKTESKRTRREGQVCK